MTRSEIIDALHQLVEEVPAKIRQYAEADLAIKPGPGKWSKKEILGHLADSALHNWQRFVQVQFEPQPFVFQPYDQHKLVAINGYQSQPIEDILSLWKALNGQIIRVLSTVPQEQLSYVTVHRSSRQQNSLHWLIEDYLMHLQHHLHQIFNHT